MSLAYRIALACGALPLLVGVSIFVLWTATRSTWLMAAGLYTVYAGMAVVLVGGIALARYYRTASRAAGVSPRRLRLSTCAAGLLLLSNFPVAGGIIAAVIAIETCYTVVVHNASNEPLDDVRVFGGGCDESLGRIPPGDTAQESFWIDEDGQLEFRARRAAAVHQAVIDWYVSNNLGGHTVVTVNADGTITAENRHLSGTDGS